MSDINSFSDESVEKIRRALADHNNDIAKIKRSLATQGSRRHPLVYPPMPKAVQVRNNSGELIPFGSVMCISSSEEGIGTNMVQYVVTKPTTTLERCVLVCTSANGIPIGSSGDASWLWDAGYVAYDTGTPAIGESWGPKQGQWTLSKWRYGFTVTGTTQTINGISCLSAYQQPVDEFLGQTDASHAKGATGTISVFDGNEADTSINVSSVKNLFANLATTKKVMCRWTAGKWQLVAGEC